MGSITPLANAEIELLALDAMTLCAIPAPTFHEEQRAQAIISALGSAGLHVQRDTVGNVVVRLGGDGPALALCAHLDSVFPSLDPITVTRDGSRLIGPGIGDNALGLAALLYIARKLASAPPMTPVVLAATVGEEGLGDLRGVNALLDVQAISGLIAIEGHGIDSLATGGVAAVRLRVALTGPGGHSWSDRGCGSAIHALLATGDRAVHVAPPAALNIGIVEGGTAVNAIAEYASMLIDIRHQEQRTVDASEARVRHALVQDLPNGITVEITDVGRRPGGCNRENEPLIAAAHAARAAVGLTRADEQTASTDANAAHARDIPAVGIGISRGDNAHRTDEWIALPPAALGAAALNNLVRGIAGTKDFHK